MRSLAALAHARSRPICLAIPTLALATGCLQTSIHGQKQTSYETGTSGGSTGSSAGTSSGIGSSVGPGSSTTAGPGTTGGTSGASTGGTTGGASSTGTTGGPPIGNLDAGYVFCTDSEIAEDSPDGDAGPAAWQCLPGTYFCDLSGDAGSCAQCRSDADCANRTLPTYDPRRPYCDLHSGTYGYQGFCQQCLDDAECIGNPAGPLCNLNPSYAAYYLEQSIEPIGFEACGELQADCRLDAGPRCGVNERCDQDGGECDELHGSCSADQDCTDAFSRAPYLTEPYCVVTASSTVLADGGLFNGSCSPSVGKLPADNCDVDSDCPSPLTCENAFGTGLSLCSCTDSSQCQGFWPVCEGLDAGFTGSKGQAVGTCGCDSDAQCADAGLVCIVSPNGPNTGQYNLGSYCGQPCTAPGFPSCVAYSAYLEGFGNFEWLPPLGPICDSSTGLCAGCTTDQQCQTGAQTGGARCVDGGACACLTDADCAPGWKCGPGYPYSICTPSLPECTPESCFPNAFCDWDSGDCTLAFSCLEDADCYSQGFEPVPQPFCDSSTGACVACRTDADCLHSGAAALGASSCSQGSCSGNCTTDQDCMGNSSGPACVGEPGRQHDCGCASNADCAGSPLGSTCVTDLTNPIHGQCGCQSLADCGPGQSCRLEYSGFGQCGSGCTADSDCPSQYFCDPYTTCRPRCDGTHACAGADPVCDSKDVSGLNGKGAAGSAPGVVWCVECVTAADCPSGEGCLDEACGECLEAMDCRPSEPCVTSGNSRACASSCADGPCPNGEACDTLNLAGNGANLCYQCVTAADCSDNRGCNGATHICGSCENDFGQYDCLAGDVCSTYWIPEVAGTCLRSCDLESCPASEPVCGLLPSLSTLQKYCFGCLQDSDCADAGPGAWCDVSVNRTYTCQVP